MCILGPLASWGLSEAMALDACALWCLHVPRVHAAPRLRFGMPIYRPMLVHPLVKKYKIYCVHNTISSSMKRSPHRFVMTIAVITPLHQRSPHRSIIYTAVTKPLLQTKRSPNRWNKCSGWPTARRVMTMVMYRLAYRSSYNGGAATAIIRSRLSSL